MIRILFDELADSHKDIFLKVDVTPSFLKVADSYFLEDYLTRDFESNEEIILNYLEYFKRQIQEMDVAETFIPFDLSDQYIGGVFVSNAKKGLLKVEYGWNKAIKGYGVNQNSIKDLVQEFREDFLIDEDWLLSKEAVLQGLNWSIEKIKNISTTSPSTPYLLLISKKTSSEIRIFKHELFK